MIIICKICGKRGAVYGRGAGTIPGYCKYHKALALAKRTKRQVKETLNELDRIVYGREK